MTSELQNYSKYLSHSPRKNLRRPFSYYIQNESAITCNILGYGNGNQRIRELVRDGMNGAKRHTAKNLTKFDYNWKLLNEIILFAKKIDVNVILYSSPVYYSYFENLELNQLRITLESGENLSLLYSNCFYFNFMKDVTFKQSDFQDTDHLNDKGAEKLSKKMNEIIISINLEK